MWIFTQDGFFSAVKARPDDPRNTLGDDALAVRARRKQHLANLKARFPQLIGKVKVHKSTNSDYRWRIFVKREVWATVVAEIVRGLNYGNFKSSIPAVPGAAEYRNRLHDVWDVMYGLQLSEPGEQRPPATSYSSLPLPPAPKRGGGSAGGGTDPMLGVLGVRRRPPEELLF
jgi:hypothetical protein